MIAKHSLQRKPQQAWTVLIWLVVVNLLLSACGSSQQKQYKVGVLAGVPGVAPRVVDGFKAGMTELGYIEGENIAYDVQNTPFDVAAYQSALKKFVDEKVDLIFVFPTEAALEAKTITQGTDIPVVFSFCLIEGVGLVENVREPGGNITGVRYPSSDMTTKRFEILQQMVPSVKRIWLPYQKNSPIVHPQAEALKPLVEAAGITLIEFPAANLAEVQAELDKLSAAEDPGMDAILTLTEPLVSQPEVAAAIAKFSREHKIPFGGMSVATETIIFSLTIDPFVSGQMAAAPVDKIFKGTSAGTLPVVSPDYILTINYKAAQELGIAVPESLLKQANNIVR